MGDMNDDATPKPDANSQRTIAAWAVSRRRANRFTLGQWSLVLILGIVLGGGAAFWTAWAWLALLGTCALLSVGIWLAYLWAMVDEMRHQPPAFRVVRDDDAKKVA